ncbi:hypothetical protein Hanom_Chr13g01209641 [Helianthus anomalus]
MKFYFEGKIKVVECGEGEEEWYEATVGGFHLPNQAALEAPLPQGKGNLGALGDPDGKGVKTAHVVVVVDRKKKKKTEKPYIILVKQVASAAAKPPTPTLTPPSSPPKATVEQEKKIEDEPEVLVLSSEGTPQLRIKRGCLRTLRLR